MFAYQSSGENQFIGVSSNGQRSTALDAALNLARQFYGTQFVNYQEIPIQLEDAENLYVAITATPMLISVDGALESKELTVVNDDPHVVVYIPDGGDIGLPFFNAAGSKLVYARTSTTNAHVAYYATIRARGFLQHIANWPTTVYVQLLTSQDQAVGQRVRLGALHVGCGNSFAYEPKASIDPDLYTIASKARIDFDIPLQFKYC